jgi:hypothetical protein
MSNGSSGAQLVELVAVPGGDVVGSLRFAVEVLPSSALAQRKREIPVYFSPTMRQLVNNIYKLFKTQFRFK